MLRIFLGKKNGDNADLNKYNRSITKSPICLNFTGVNCSMQRCLDSNSTNIPVIELHLKQELDKTVRCQIVSISFCFLSYN